MNLDKRIVNIVNKNYSNISKNNFGNSTCNVHIEISINRLGRTINNIFESLYYHKICFNSSDIVACEINKSFLNYHKNFSSTFEKGMDNFSSI